MSFDLCAIFPKPPLWQAGEPSGYGLMACFQIPTLTLTTEWSWASLHHEIFHLLSGLKTLSSIVLAHDPEISLLNFIPKRIVSRCSNKNLYVSIHSSIIHNSQKGETTQTFINWWMDEQNMSYPYNGILFSDENEGSIDTCYNMDESCSQDANWKNLDTKSHILYDSIYRNCPKWTNPHRQKVD